ncbi:MAG TPA: nitroreductase family deazaflavin-dependent oxidoreductase [Pseudonocardiaceae bacterium]|nr:nitroreductase family deazaflavin-dependent oxidoreductase [Pseudonocardiaceae bacterium]
MSPVREMVRRLSHQRWLAAAVKVLTPIDRVLLERTTGRASLTGVVGMPAVLLTTTGRRSGQPRSVALTFVRHDDGLVVVGSNFGQAHHPAWSVNLLAHPAATVAVRGAEWQVRARLFNDAEKAAVWPELLRLWPGYAAYQERSGRDLRVFLLTPGQPPSG